MSDERQSDTIVSPWWGEHTHRYLEALELIPENSKIIDIACGSGFGAALLASKGHKVTGGDVSADTIQYCKDKYAGSDLEFRVIDGTNIDYADNHFDAVVSFETIEHTTEYTKMLQEFKRVSKNIVILSTPNITINNPGGIVTNPYHTQEWAFEQLKEILDGIFPSVTIYGQQYSRYPATGNFRMKMGKIIESFLYLRGIRKTPIHIQDAIMRFFINKPMYPLATDYSLVSGIEGIKACKTFFVICKL